MFIRLKPYNPKLGQLIKSYSLKGRHFVAGGQAIEVTDPDAIARLAAHRNDGPKEALAFEVSETPFGAAEEDEPADAPASTEPRPGKPGPKPTKGKPGPKPGAKAKTARGTIPSLEE